MTDTLKGLAPESWNCVDCGRNTAPGLLTRVELEAAFAADEGDEGVTQTITAQSEVYTVRDRVWQEAGMKPMGGCLCIKCLEDRIGGRRLRQKDFLRGHAFNAPHLPGTALLLQRRGAR
jgi:hypothetical protein